MLLGVKWHDRATNEEVLEHCDATGIEAMIIRAQQYVGLDVSNARMTAECRNSCSTMNCTTAIIHAADK